jgi:hypothetical protein
MADNDPWKSAQAQTAQGQGQNGAQGDTQLAEAYVPEPETESQLFSGGGDSFPELFNKTHPLGTERTGIITKVQDVHSRTYKVGAPGDLKYWQEGEEKPVTKPVNPITGQRNRPVMDTVITVQTEYRVTDAECAAINRRREFVQQDTGMRRFTAGGFDYKVTKEALQRDAVTLGLQKTSDLIGKRLTVKRVGQKPTSEGNASWVLEVKFSQP